MGGNTTLKGGAVTSTQTAVEQGRNTFTSEGALTTTDIQNNAHYKATSVSVSVGTGMSPAGQLMPAGSVIGLGKDSDSDASTTQAAISGMAGNKDARTGDKETGIAQIFNAGTVQREVEAQVQITQLFSTQAPKVVASYADKQKTMLTVQASTETDPTRKAALLADSQHWEEGGAYRVALHTATAGLAGGAAGAAGAGTVAAAAPLMNELQSSISRQLAEAGVNPTVAKGAAQAVALTTAATLGAVAGGGTVQGAAAGWNVDANNRQLHPTEAQWIKDNASRYAKQKGMSEAQAERALAQQAFRQVQAGAAGVWDTEASAFLSQAHGMLAADPNCPSCGPGYMFFATPQQKAIPEMYAEQVISDPNALAFYGRNGITQPTSKQIQTSVGKDAAIRSKVTNATMVAAGAAVAVTVTLPPALSWCLGNPVACNQIAIAGGEITAGDALGPASLAVIGAASAVKAVRSADEVNAAMKAHGWAPPWAPGTPVIETMLQPGTKVNMIVDAKTADAIKKGDPIIPGGWATFDNVDSVARDMRQRAAITNQFKTIIDGPFYVVEMEVTEAIKSNIGFAGKQIERSGGMLRGGGTQVQFDEAINGADRSLFLKPTSLPKALQ